ncbi:DUF594 family protein [Quillaja saponaria]|uniref:DUF594 family protein n=1 Tax=Quillaja saponaria TaxID=32244 RepID=A0AAD7LS75_QUISA|nr:DUF594 family protein [Quillaja saponaria]
MLITIFSSYLLIKNRNLVQIFPKRLRELWSLWEIRSAVILSLILQIILILLGKRRKISRSSSLRFFLWFAYLSSDATATFCLSAISSTSGDTQGGSDDPNLGIMAFWAPLLVLHLGGQDTITAYSLEDNELYSRRFLGLGVQLIVAGNVIVRAWTNASLNFLVIPIFIAGIIKNGERIWALWHASRDHFRDSMLPPPDPGPNYAKYMEEYRSRTEEGFDVSLRRFIEPPIGSSSNNISFTTDRNSSLSEAEFLLYANNFFSIFKRLCADLILSFHDIENSQSFLRSRSCDEAFKLIEIELGFMYDLFYTKAAVAYSLIGGGCRRLGTFSFTITALWTFSVIKKDAYHKADVIITYLLLIGAIILEIRAVIVVLFSDWVIVWLHKHNNAVVHFLCRAIFSIRRARNRWYNTFFAKIGWSNTMSPITRWSNTILAKHRWSNTMAQYNLITFCLKDRPANCIVIRKIKSIYQSVEKYWSIDSKKVPDELKELIFQEFQRKLNAAENFKGCKNFCAYKGDWVLQQKQCYEKFCWSVDVAIDQSIILWHIATDLCYYSELDTTNKNSDPENVRNSKDMSRLLSNYMLYLLVMCPFMLPNGIGQIRFRDTCAEANVFFKDRNSILYRKEAEACKELLEVDTQIPPLEVKGDRCKSLLFDACRLAKSLNGLDTEQGWDRTKKWELISHVWVEMLSYAASQCRWNHHAEQLRRGGELLTHVWLLMAHLGITEQFQISQGHARARLIHE